MVRTLPNNVRQRGSQRADSCVPPVTRVARPERPGPGRAPWLPCGCPFALYTRASLHDAEWAGQEVGAGLDSCASLPVARYSPTTSMVGCDRRQPNPGSKALMHDTPLRVALLALGALACQPQAAPELLQVSAVVPAEAQFGDAVQVVGDGFALGNPATVTLRGAVYRAGLPPSSLDISFRARTDSQRELSLELPRAAQAAFCGERGQAAHATFRGDVQVAIAARAPGAPPVTGALHGAVLELYPAIKDHTAQVELSAEGRRALGFFGIDVGESPGAGLGVTHVAPGSRAASADLRLGDRIVRAGGLSVFSPSDLVPEPTRTLELAVMRGPVEQSVWLDADGLTPRPPRDVHLPALLVSAAALGFFAWASPATRVFGWLLHNLVEHLRGRSHQAVRGAPLLRSRVSRFGRVLGWLGGALGICVWLGIASALLSPSLRSGPVDRSLGLLGIMFGSSTAIAVWSLLYGGHGAQHWSFSRGLRAAFQHSVIVAPGWVALFTIGCETGVDFDDLVRGQGAAPWTWNAFTNPGLTLSFGLLLLTALPRVVRPNLGLEHARPPRPVLRARGDNVLGWVYLCSVCAVAAVAFLGGDAWPQKTLAGTPGAAVAGLPAALLLLAKYTGLLLAVAWLRALCLDVSLEQWGRLSWRVCLPLALFAFALAHGFRSLASLPPFWAWLQQGFGPVCIALVCLSGGVLVACTKAAVRQPSSPARLSPWL